MEGRSFGNIEERIAPVIKNLNDELLLENLSEEARLSVEALSEEQEQATAKTNLVAWKEAQTNNNITLDPSQYPLLSGSTWLGNSATLGIDMLC